MRVDAFLAELSVAPVVSFEELAGGGGIVVVAPHPDDESLGCGGLIAMACRVGRPVRLIVLSDGCGSHPESKLYPPPALRDLREAETREAGAVLGLAPDAIRFLRLPDAFVPRTGPEAEAAADAVLAAVAETGASAVFVTWRHDPHRDHEAAARIVELARPRLKGVRVLAYPVWGWTLPGDTEIACTGTLHRLDVSADRRTKREAVSAHRSQTADLVQDDPGRFRLADALIDRMCGPFEHFVRETGVL